MITKLSTNRGMSRRSFIGTSALGITSFTILPSWTIDGVRIAPSDRVVMGVIGLGQQALSDFAGFASVPGVQFAACCDVDQMKQQRFKKRVESWQTSKSVPARCDMYERYEELLERKDIDAVEVATPDHWHTIAPIEVGCSTNTLCCLGNIATELQRPVKWNPATLSFGDDKEAAAHRLYKYEYRRPYTLNI